VVRSPLGIRIRHLPPDVVDEVLAAHRRTGVRTGLRTAGRTYGTGRGSYGCRAYRDVRPQRAPYGLLRTGQLLPYGNQLRTDVLRTGLRTGQGRTYGLDLRTDLVQRRPYVLHRRTDLVRTLGLAAHGLDSQVLLPRRGRVQLRQPGRAVQRAELGEQPLLPRRVLDQVGMGNRLVHRPVQPGQRAADPPPDRAGLTQRPQLLSPQRDTGQPAVSIHLARRTVARLGQPDADHDALRGEPPVDPRPAGD